MKSSIKYLLLCVTIILLQLNSFGQNIDSLKLALKNAKHDTTRCGLLVKIIEADNEYEVSTRYNDECFELSKKRAQELSQKTPKNDIYNINDVTIIGVRV